MSFNNFDLVLLNSQFYTDFASCGQILHKQNRPYLMVLINIHGIEFAVPLRSHCNDKEATYRTDNSENDYKGLDFSKSVILSDYAYVECTTKLFDPIQKTAILDFEDKIIEK